MLRSSFDPQSGLAYALLDVISQPCEQNKQKLCPASLHGSIVNLNTHTSWQHCKPDTYTTWHTQLGSKVNLMNV